MDSTRVIRRLCLIAIGLLAASDGLAQFARDSCTWELNRPRTYPARAEEVLASAAECEEHVAGDPLPGEDVWFGAATVSSSVPGILDLPEGNCDCGNRINRWSWYPHIAETYPESQPCRSWQFSCTHPGTGCEWVAAGMETAEEITNEGFSRAADCRLFAAKAGGAYFGSRIHRDETGASSTFSGWEAASVKPETPCMCGEVRRQWFSDWPGGDAAYCGAFKFRCRLVKRYLKEVPSWEIPAERMADWVPEE